MIRRLLILSTGILIGALCFADNPPGPIATQPPTPLSPTSPPPSHETIEIGFNPTTVYYSFGPINLMVPWKNPAIGEGYDFNAKKSAEKVVTTFLCPVLNLWIFNGVGGAAMDANGTGSPVIGLQLPFNNPIEAILPIHQLGLTATWGYNFNAKRNLIVASAYKRFF